MSKVASISGLLENNFKSSNSDTFVIEAKLFIEDYHLSNDGTDKLKIAEYFSTMFSERLQSEYTVDDFMPLTDQIIDIIKQ